MYWYFAGAAVCLISARNLKRRVSGQKRIYQALFLMAGGFLIAGAAAWMEGNEKQETQIFRNRPGQGEQEKTFLIDVEGELKDYPIELDIMEKKLTKTQKKECLNQAKKELDVLILGENPSKDQVTEALYLPEYLQEGAVEASYSFSDYDIFRPDGTLEQEPRQPVLVEITAELDCQEEVCLYQFSVQAVPRKKSVQEAFIEKVQALVFSENQQENSDYLELPSQVDGKRVIWREKGMKSSLIIAFMGMALAVGILLREKEEKRRKVTEREKQMLVDYPGIVSKLSLLLGAGMNLSLAWEKTALAYQKKREAGELEQRFAYEEMLSALFEIRDGVGELQAYENFGYRCQLSEYRRLSSLIVQNIRKGAKGMQKLLEQEEWDAYEQRKIRAKHAGEQAGTKLLLPMGLMLVIVLAILVIPAGMSLDL